MRRAWFSALVPILAMILAQVVLPAAQAAPGKGKLASRVAAHSHTHTLSHALGAAHASGTLQTAGGTITVRKDFCSSVGQRTTCNKSGINETGTTVTFTVYQGTTVPTATNLGTSIGTIDCTVSQSASSGGASCQQTSTFDTVIGDYYAVCENTTFTGHSGTYLSNPRPELSTGGQQSIVTTGTQSCITFLESSGSGNAVTNFLNVLEPTGQVQVCKTFVGTFPTGTTFTFTATGGGLTGSTTFTPSGTQQCQTISTMFPVGTAVTVTETASGGFTDYTTDLSGSVTIAQGLNTLNVTNSRLGQVRICKTFVGTFPTGTTFTITATGGGVTTNNTVTFTPSGVQQCQTIPATFPVGTVVTLTETASGGFTNYTTNIPATTAISTTGLNTVNVTNTLNTGTIQICKLSQVATGPGALPAGETFNFTIDGTIPVNNVAQGMLNCVSTTVTAGQHAVAETVPADALFVSCAVTPTSALVGTACGNPVTVNVGTGQTVQVVFTDSAVISQQLVELKICKTISDISLVGQTFTFTATGGGVTSAASFTFPASALGAACTPVGFPTLFPANTTVTITETATTPMGGTFTAFTTNWISGTATSNGHTATVNLGTASPVIVYVDNSAVQSIQMATLQVCKVGQGGLAGTFNFTIMSSQAPMQVVSNTISAATPTACQNVAVPVGPVTVSEASTTPFTFVGCATTVPGSGTTTPCTMSGGAATLSLPTTCPASGTVCETVTFTNEPPPPPPATAQLEICKAGTGGLAGTFTFSIAGTGGFATTVNRTVSATTTIDCGTANVTVPVGAIMVTESSATAFTTAGCTITVPSVSTVTSCGTTGSASFNIGAAGATVTFTNAPAATTISCGTFVVTPAANGMFTVSSTLTANTPITSIVETANTVNFTPLTITPPLSTSPMQVNVSATTTAIPAQLEIRVTAGTASVLCDPIATRVTRLSGLKFNKLHLSGWNVLTVPKSDHYLKITNDAAHPVSGLKIVVNARVFVVSHLKAGEARYVDLASAMHSGKNMVLMMPLGQRGGTASLMFLNTPPAT